jgi:leader peptidase (prepilin peptidase)/N-methyltransferase
MQAFATFGWLVPLMAAPFVGSFLGLLIERLPAGRGVLLGRSACAHCGQTLGFRDLLPLLSWLLNRGRCRHCGTRLGFFHPAIELAALATAIWAAMVLDGEGWILWAGCLLGWTLLALALIDARHLLLPDALTLPLLPVGLAAAYALDPAALTEHAIGAAAGFAVFYAIGASYRRLRGREGLGMGDAKLLAAAGAWVSWSGLPSVVFIAGVLALTGVLASSLMGRTASWTDKTPFGAYLAAATWLVWLYGPLSFG